MSKRKLPPSQRRNSGGFAWWGRGPRTADERFEYIAGFLTSFHKKDGKGPEVVRLNVHKALEEALDCYGPFLGPEVELEGKMEPTVNAAGMFRMVINEHDIDCGDHQIRDHVSDVVDRAITIALNDPACGRPLAARSDGGK